MSFQTISSDKWQAALPDGWLRGDSGTEGVTYFESPDRCAGAYFSAWRTRDQSLFDAMQDTRAIEYRQLPPSSDGSWEIVGSTECVNEGLTEFLTEYLNRVDRYRIVSRLLGRGDWYVRFTFHDYNCADLAVSKGLSDPWLASLALREATVHDRETA
jgi:hypothetical protein